MPLWLSWSLYCYHMGTVDARRSNVVVALVFGLGGVIAGVLL